MMKGGGVAAFFLLFCLALAQCSAASYSKAPAPPKTRAAAPVYSCWHPDPKLVKCLGAYHTASATCYHEICVSYWTRKVAIQQDCCKAIVEMEDDCANYVFSKFNYFQALLQHNCSSKASPARPKSAGPSPPKHK